MKRDIEKLEKKENNDIQEVLNLDVKMFDEPLKEVKKKPAIMFQSSVPLKVPELKDKRHSVNSFMLMYKPKERPDT